MDNIASIDELFGLYKSCFPGIIREDDKVRSILANPDNVFLARRDGEALVGAAVMNGNVVLLLCVAPGYRGRGIGGGLLSECESLAAAGGFDELRFCDGPDYIAPGIPIFGPDYAANAEFFGKRGYVHSWDDCECVDMSMNLADFPDTDAGIGDEVRGVLYRWASPDERADVTDCARDGWEQFAKYYADESLYTGGKCRVLAAFADGKVVGALLVELENEAPGVGSVGCTVTRAAYQRRGIASTLVRLGTKYLRERGLPKGYLGYTYTDIIRMYAKSGYSVCMKYLMGVKKLCAGQPRAESDETGNANG